jgi:hypothetical protein
MTAVLLFCVSVAALCFTGLSHWRKRMRRVSALPVSELVRIAARIAGTTVGSHDFRVVVSTYDLVPDLRGSGGSFRALRGYYALVEKLGRWIPSMAKWSEAEMTCCSRYAAVLVGQHLERNQSSAAKMRGT